MAIPEPNSIVRPVDYGAHVLLRYRYPDGRLQAALPMRVVEDRADRLVARVIPVQAPYQVLHFWDDDGTFSGWYINLEAPKTRRGTRLDTVDWHLDLWIDGAGVANWKDEDEARAAVEAGHLPERDLELAWRTGHQILPPAGWRALGLPSDWAY